MNWKWDRWESSGDLLEIFWRCSGEGRRGAEGTQRGMGAQKGSREGESSGDVLEMFWLQKDRRRNENEKWNLDGVWKLNLGRECFWRI